MSNIVVIKNDIHPQNWVFRKSDGTVMQIGQLSCLVGMIGKMIDDLPAGETVAINRGRKVRRLTLLTDDDFREGSFWFEQDYLSYRVLFEKLEFAPSPGLETEVPVLGRYEPSF